MSEAVWISQKPLGAGAEGFDARIPHAGKVFFDKIRFVQEVQVRKGIQESGGYVSQPQPIVVTNGLEPGYVKVVHLGQKGNKLGHRPDVQGIAGIDNQIDIPSQRIQRFNHRPQHIHIEVLLWCRPIQAHKSDGINEFSSLSIPSSRFIFLIVSPLLFAYFAITDSSISFAVYKSR